MSLSKLRIQRQFDHSAARYDRHAEMQRSIVDELLAAAIPGFDTAADLGCGTGYALQKLMLFHPRSLTGLDLAPGMLQAAAQAMPEARLVQGDIEALPFTDNAFDLSLSSSAIQWCDTTTAVSELQRVTRPGGQILLSTFIDGTLSDWRRLWQLPDQGRFLPADQFEKTVSGCGFHHQRFWYRSFQNRFYSFDSAVRSIRELGAGNAENNMSRGLFGRRRFEEIRRQINELIDQQGYIELNYQAAFAELRV